MKSNDKNIEIQYEYNRTKYFKKTAPEYYINGNTIQIRAIKIELETENEILLTFSYK